MLFSPLKCFSFTVLRRYIFIFRFPLYAYAPSAILGHKMVHAAGFNFEDALKLPLPLALNHFYELFDTQVC